MSSDSEEGTENVQPSQIPGMSSEATGEILGHWHDLAILQDELSRVKAETRSQRLNGNPTPTRSYI
jgi:hypothetical protein